MAQGMQDGAAHVEFGPSPVVLMERWMYLDKPDLKEHCQRLGVAVSGTRQMLANRLCFDRRVRYSEVLYTRILVQMLRRENACPVPIKEYERRTIMEEYLRTHPPPPPQSPPHQPPGGPPPPPGPSPESPGPHNVFPPRPPVATPPQWRKGLERLHRLLQAQGRTLTKERCAVQLQDWGKLPEGCAVYHVISPVDGGRDHPHNYVVLPDEFPADYDLVGKSDLHHMLMLELLGAVRVKTALKAGLVGAGGQDAAQDPLIEEEATARLRDIQRRVREFKRNATLLFCGPTSGGAGGGAAAGGGGGNGGGGDDGDGDASHATGGNGGDDDDGDEPPAQRRRTDDGPCPSQLAAPAQP